MPPALAVPPPALAVPPPAPATPPAGPAAPPPAPGVLPAPVLPPMGPAGLFGPGGTFVPIIDDFDPDVPKWYVVWRGVRVGVFASWDQASLYVNGVSGAAHKGHTVYSAAINAFYTGVARGTVRQLPDPAHP
ncbi:hypothetical protein EVJ58_g10851 [Rhodofomes roseus]|uniref:Ribonuclease H1 N-terminal domain-containing protein n=1 Tax=Rhodofomes roseus TaxID=34475 RepID=A0A4Y9XKV4_9APHY|nr:hypothetical protein EVJ58_g10851 [Rhodofomes roseus]